MNPSDPSLAPAVVVADDPDVGPGARTTLWTVRLLGEAGYRPFVLTPDPTSMAAASRHAAGRSALVPGIDDEGFRRSVEALRAEVEAVEVLPCGDRGVLALHPEHRPLIDKCLLPRRVEAAGLRFPPTVTIADAAEAVAVADRVTLPAVVKPATSHGARVVADRDAFVDATRAGFPLLVQPFLDEPIRSVAGVRVGERFLAIVHQRFDRIWPPRAGMASASTTTGPDPELEERIGILLDGYEGVFQVQFLGPYVMDVNLRVYASLSLARAAGLNLPAIFCDARTGEAPPLRYARAGVRYRWLDGDVRSIAAHVGGGRMPIGRGVAALLPRPGTARGGVESIRDPGPLAARVRAALRRHPTVGRPRAIVAEGRAARVTIATARALDAGGFAVDVVTSNRSSLAEASRHVDRVVHVDFGDIPDAVEDLSRAGGHVRVFPTGDGIARALGLPGSELVGKLELYRHAEARGVPVPPTEVFPDAEALRGRARDLAYPVLLKPAVGKPARRASGPQDVEPFLARAAAMGTLLAQPILEGPVVSVSGVMRDGRPLALVHQRALRAWPSISGTTSAAITVPPDPRLETWALALVADHDGIFQAQFLDGVVIDLNLRPYGSLGLALAAGVNLPAIEATGLAPGEQAPARARPGVRYRWLEGDLQLLRRALGREPGRAVSILWEYRPHPGTAHGDPWSWRDPRPAFARLRLRGASR